MKMSICRTCLSKNNLKPIFPDKNHSSLRTKDLFAVTGIKIEAGDGLPQLICTPCNNLVNEALKLREQSTKSDSILKLTIKPDTNHDSKISKENDAKTDICEQISGQEKIAKMNIYNPILDKEKKYKPDINKTFQQEDKSTKNGVHKRISRHENNLAKYDIYTPIFNPEKNSRLDIYKQKNNMTINDSNDKKSEGNVKIKSENQAKMDSTVRIEDFESSNDENIMNDIHLEDLESDSSGEEKRVCIEDFESSDSFDEEDMIPLIEESKTFKCNWILKEKEFLERERRKMELKEQDDKLMSLAASPYEPGGPIRCTLCNKQVRNIQNFKSHAKTHFEPQNACEECGKKFINRSHMRYHQQRLHGRKKRLECSQCTYRAVDTQQLQNHKRAAHTGERPYICDVCGDSFRMRANIAQHMRKHFGVKNLQCERCPAMFRSRSELTGHQNRVHNHIYTYYCYLCTETYKRPASVRKHLINIHGVSRNQQLPIKCVRTQRSCDKT